MTSREQKIKSKREQEEKEIRQVRMAVGAVAAIVVIGIIVYVVINSGILEPPPVDVATLSDVSGTPQEICNQATPAIANGEDGMYAGEQPPQVLEQGVDYQAIFCAETGPIYVDLFEDITPTTVNNFVFLVNENFYNQTVFHRVLEGFMAQGGDPTGTGRGGPGYQFEDEVFPDVVFDRPYLLAMANSGPGTNGSQFFITYAPTDWLNGLHTIFGEVMSGQANADALTRIDPQQPSGVTPSVLEAIVIVTPEQVTQQ